MKKSEFTEIDVSALKQKLRLIEVNAELEELRPLLDTMNARLSAVLKQSNNFLWKERALMEEKTDLLLKIKSGGE